MTILIDGRRFQRRTRSAAPRPGYPRRLEGCGAPRGALGCDLTIAIRTSETPVGAPRGFLVACSVPAPGLSCFYPMRPTRRTSRQARTAWAPRQAEGVTLPKPRIRSPAPFGYAGRTPSVGGDGEENSTGLAGGDKVIADFDRQGSFACPRLSNSGIPPA